MTTARNTAAVESVGQRYLRQPIHLEWRHLSMGFRVFLFAQLIVVGLAFSGLRGAPMFVAGYASLISLALLLSGISMTHPDFHEVFAECTLSAGTRSRLRDSQTKQVDLSQFLGARLRVLIFLSAGLWAGFAVLLYLNL